MSYVPCDDSRADPKAMVESIEAIKTSAIHADARGELAKLLEKAADAWSRPVQHHFMSFNHVQSIVGAEKVCS